MERAVAWYTETLGLHLKANYGNHTAILTFSAADNSAPIICLIKLEEGEKSAANVENGTYPVLELDSEQGRFLYQDLKNKGVRVEENPGHEAHFKFYDPDGNQIEAYLPGIYE